MDQEFLLAATTQFRTQSELWLETIKRDESLTVLFFPKTDRHIRLSHLLNSPKLIDHVLGKNHGYIFRPMNFEAHDVEDIGDLIYQIEERLNLSHINEATMRFEHWVREFKTRKQTLVLIISEAEKYLNGVGKSSLAALSDLVDQYSPQIKVISFFESDITHPSVSEYLPSKTNLYENILHYTLYGEKDSEFFIDLLTSYWKSKPVPKNTKHKIYEDCGGHFWLIKEAMRYLMDFGEWKKQESGMQFRLRSIYNMLSETEKEVLNKTQFEGGKLDEMESLSFKYLKEMRLFENKRQMNIGAFRDFVQSKTDPSKVLELKDKDFAMNGVNITMFFSRKEYRVLLAFLKKRGQLLTREEVAHAMWPVDTQAHFSEWAIDQLVARLRKRLTKLGLSGKMITSNRGQGYTLL